MTCVDLTSQEAIVRRNRPAGTTAFILGLAISFGQLDLRGQQQSVALPQFEVASVKLNPRCENGFRGGNLSPSPGRLEMPCVTLESLLQTAYGTFGDGMTINTEPLHMEGGPAWLRSERYAVSAKSDGPVRTELLAAPMLQNLLEERFHLKIRRETRQVSVYALSAAKGGLKIAPLVEGACTPLDLSHPPPPPKAGEPSPSFCGVMRLGPAGKGGMMMEVRGVTMVQFAQRLSGRLDRTVIDKTGIAGQFNFHLEFSPDTAIPGQNLNGAGQTEAPLDPDRPSLFTALQEQIGLKLTPDKGPVSFLVIDHVEKPTAN